MVLTLVTFFGVLGLIVLVHEAGHFVMARRAGVRIDEFGLGLPPRIFGFYHRPEGGWQLVGPRTKQAPTTIWSLNWIPLGGFVKIKGEQGDAVADLDSFSHRPIGVRALILSAGVSMNVILTVVLLSVAFAFGVPQVIDGNPLPSTARVRDQAIQIIEILPDSPALAADLKVGDRLLAFDGQPLAEITAIQDYLDQRIGQPTELTIERKKETITVTVIPEIISQTDRGGIGTALLKTAVVSYPWYLAPWYGLQETGRAIIGIVVGFYLIIKNLIVSQHLIGDVYGPVGIAGLVGDAARLGFAYVVQLTAYLSLIIAVINYLPFPALDGGRVLFLIIEAVRGRPVNQRLEAFFHNLGFALLMLLVLIITFRDLARMFGQLSGLWSGLGQLF